MIVYGYDIQNISNFFEQKGLTIDGKFIVREFENLNVTGYLVFDDEEKCKTFLTLLSIGNKVIEKVIEEHNNCLNSGIVPPIDPNIIYDNDIRTIQMMKREGAYIDALVKCLDLLEKGQFCENLCMSIYKILACTGQTNIASIAVTIAIAIAKANGQVDLLMNDQMHKETLLETIEDVNALEGYLKSISGQSDYSLVLPYKYSYDALVNQSKY